MCNQHKIDIFLKYPTLGFDKLAMSVWETDYVPWDNQDQRLLQSFSRRWLERTIKRGICNE